MQEVKTFRLNEGNARSFPSIVLKNLHLNFTFISGVLKKDCLSVPGQKSGTERLVLRCLSVPGQNVSAWDRKAGQNVWDRRAGTERLDTTFSH